MHAGFDAADAALARVMARSRLASRGFLVIESDEGTIALARPAASSRSVTANLPLWRSGTSALDGAVPDDRL